MGDPLEEVGFVGADAKMTKLDLGLSPGQRGSPFERRQILVLIGQVDRALASRGDESRKDHSRRGTGRNPNPSSEAQNWIEHRPCGVRERPAVYHGNRIAYFAAPAQEAGPSGLVFKRRQGLTFYDDYVTRPDARLAGRTRAPRSEQCRKIGNELGLYKKIRKRRVRGVAGRLP